MSELLNEVKSLVNEFNKAQAYKESVEALAQPFINKIKESASLGATSITFKDECDLTQAIIDYFKEQGFKVTFKHAYHIYITIDWSD